jgi:UDP-glucoronosyl and UDP-glucosyl transferase
MIAVTGGLGYVADCARAIALLQCAGTLHHSTYNVGSGRPASPAQVRDALRDIVPGAALDLAPGRDPGGPGRDTWLDIARVLVTTSAVPPGALRRPAGMAVVAFVPHPAVLPHASVMITHGGHGSVTAALAHGVPLVCIPGVGADQPVIAARVAALGAGATVSAQPPVGDLRKTVAHVLDTSSYRQ